MLIGNKGDQEIIRKVTKEEATTFANENEMDYMEVSSKDNMLVTQMFEKILDLTYTFYQKTGKQQITSFIIRAPKKDPNGKASSEAQKKKRSGCNC